MTLHIDTAKLNHPGIKVFQNEDPDFPLICFWMTFVYSISFIFTVYSVQDDGIAMFDRIAEKIDDILFQLRLIFVAITTLTTKRG